MTPRRVAGALRSRLERRRQDERGAIAVITGLVAVLLLIVAGFSVDIGNSWAVRGMLQKQVDYAAVFAAQKALPVKLSGAKAPSTKTAAAMAVAYYVACNPVRGQGEYDNTVPLDAARGGSVDCTSEDITQSSLSSYAAKLLATGMVTFPTSTSISVTGPAARVSFSFGPGHDDESVGEQKSATAQIYSPGSAAPVALGLQCTLSAAGTAPLGIDSLATGAVPLNYIAAGPLGANSTTEPAVADTKSHMAAGDPNGVLTSIVGNTQVQYTGATVTVNLATGTLLPLTTVPTSLIVHFYRGTDHAQTNPVGWTSAAGIGTGLLIPVPTQVTSTAGVWYVQVEFKAKPLVGAEKDYFTSLTTTKTYTVTAPAGVESLTACANLIDSPRRDTSNAVITGETMRRNIKSGMDHSLVAHPALATLNPPSPPVTAGSVLNTLNNSPSVTDCTATPGSVLDDDAARLDPLANCVTVATDGARQDEFTQGFLADPNGSFRGRLSCETTACTHGSPFTITGLPGTYNDDKLTDFINPGSILNSSLFFGLSTYLTDNVPAVTPPSTALKSDIYSSPRFFWTAVASRAVGPTACTKCPVLTFRPVFLTQDLPSGYGLTAADILQIQLQIKAGVNTAAILSTLFPWLGPAATSTDHGIVMDGTKLRALRFQTIEPTALPPVPLDYNGPVSDYLGTGPKITRLVK